MPYGPFGFFDAEVPSQPDASLLPSWFNGGREANATTTPGDGPPTYFTAGGPGDGNDARVFFDNQVGGGNPRFSLETPNFFAAYQTPGVIVAVFKKDSVAIERETIADARVSSQNWALRLDKPSGRLEVNAGKALRVVPAWDTDWHWVVIDVNGVNSRIRTSRGVDVTGDAGDMEMPSIRIGRRNSGNNQALLGSIALLGFFGSAPAGFSDTQVDYVVNRYPSLT